MDVTFTQEAELDGQPYPLQVHLHATDMPIRRFVPSPPVAELRATKVFPTTAQQFASYLSQQAALELGGVRGRGFQLAFSYSGTCILIGSVRLYYRKCPGVTEQLAWFPAAAAGSASVVGSCVSGAAEVVPPMRECAPNGRWGPPRGRCACQPGHQIQDTGCRGASGSRPRGGVLTLTPCLCLISLWHGLLQARPPGRRGGGRVPALPREHQNPGGRLGGMQLRPGLQSPLLRPPRPRMHQ